MTAYLPGFGPPPPLCHDSEGDRWFTPTHILEAVTAVLGEGWFDPCGDPSSPAAAYSSGTSYDVRQGQDGSVLGWPAAPVYANPPFSSAAKWIERCAGHTAPVIGLFPCRMEGIAWHDFVWSGAATVVLPRGRLKFVGLDGRTHGNAMIGTAFVLWGQVDASAFSRHLRQCGVDNVILRRVTDV